MFKSMKVRIGLASRSRLSLCRHRRSRPGADLQRPACPPRPCRPGTAEPLANRAYRWLVSGVDSAGAVGDFHWSWCRCRCSEVLRRSSSAGAEVRPARPPPDRPARTPRPLRSRTTVASRRWRRRRRCLRDPRAAMRRPGPRTWSAGDKPPLPVLTPENAAAVYAEPLPSFRDVPRRISSCCSSKSCTCAASPSTSRNQARSGKHELAPAAYPVCVCFPRRCFPSSAACASLVHGACVTLCQTNLSTSQTSLHQRRQHATGLGCTGSHQRVSK